MPSARASVPHNRKRQLSKAESETNLSPQPTAKRQKLEDQQRHQTPSSFWDNLSRLWLTRRALREFDRRTIWPAAPVPPHRTGKENIDFAKLKRFARHGGPSLGNIRGVSSIQSFSDSPSDRTQYPDPEASVPSSSTMNSSQSGSRKRAKTGKESDTSSTTRKSSAYKRNFEQHLIDHGVYPDGYGGVRNVQEPHNWEEIHMKLAMPRASLSPSRFSREAFLDFKEKNQDALTENKVMSKVFPIITGTADIPSQENLRFGNLKDLTDGSITKAQPDFYDGARPEDLNRQIREELGPYIVPSTNTAAPCLPNFFTEAKGPNGGTPTCKNQALYDGAVGARGIHELRSYVDPETAYDNNAYTITSTYHGGSGTLTVYTTHPTLSKDTKRPTEYRMTQLNSLAMTGNPDTFRQGACLLRNARELAKEKREELIAAANGKVPDAEHSDLVSSTHSFISQSANESPFTNEIVNGESETSADELGLDTQSDDSPTHRTPIGIRTDRPSKVSSHRRSKKKLSRANKSSGRGSGDLQASDSKVVTTSLIGD